MVRDLGRDRAVRVADREQRGGEPAGRVVECVGAQRGAEIEVGVGVDAPRHRGAVREARIADRPLLEVAAIAPVGVEEAEPAVVERGLRRVAAVLDRRW